MDSEYGIHVWNSDGHKALALDKFVFTTVSTRIIYRRLIDFSVPDSDWPGTPEDSSRYGWRTIEIKNNIFLERQPMVSTWPLSYGPGIWDWTQEGDSIKIRYNVLAVILYAGSYSTNITFNNGDFTGSTFDLWFIVGVF